MSPPTALIIQQGKRGPHQVLPPGMELLFTYNYPPNCKSSFAAVILAVHWSAVSTTHLRLISPDSGLPTELLPSNWLSQISEEDASSHYLSLNYKHPETGRHFVIKVQELTANATIAIIGADGDPKLKEEERKSRVTVLETEDYVNVAALGSGERCPSKVYRIDNLWHLREDLKFRILSDEEDARGVHEVKNNDPYASKLTPAQLEKIRVDKLEKEVEKLRQEKEQALQEPYSDPLRVRPPGNRQEPPRGIGHADLDPFAGIVGGGGLGGMLMDPRGFRRPQLPQGILPGARFDPFGPPAPGSGGLGGPFNPPGSGRGGPRLPFGFPDPDHHRPHGFDDMFS